MIADDIHDIREGMRKIAQAKVQAEAEAARRAEADSKPTELPKPANLFPEQGAPFRGFFVSEDGDIVPLGGAAPEHTWSDWIDTQEGSDPTVQAANSTSNRFTFWGYRGEDPDGQ